MSSTICLLIASAFSRIESTSEGLSVDISITREVPSSLSTLPVERILQAVVPAGDELTVNAQFVSPQEAARVQNYLRVKFR